ncbi:hypothetical protein L1987_39765 [Smallanthus sonchifolius]|uniref:Uncharacterized protein n=1 Tax=Smallanthus sonchifolius TaxID=185202 RepID=A0ACB9HPN3_9ASTR|nr:hypothetical protein L1987_39765 [Smallanthus sonchifolius]
MTTRWGKLSSAITGGDIYTKNSESDQVREKKKTLKQVLINANEVLNCITYASGRLVSLSFDATIKLNQLGLNLLTSSNYKDVS